MILIEFTPDDLTRVVFPPEPEPLWETALAARALGDRAIPPVARRWRRQAVPLIRPSMRPLFKLIAPAGQFPDFLTPEVPSPGLDAAIEVLMDAPVDLIQDELGPWLAAETDQFMQGLLAGKAGSRRALGNAVRVFHQEVLGPVAAELERQYAADLAIRARSLLHGGIERMLAGLHPDIIWTSPNLIACALDSKRHYEAHLNGRGLMLYPSSLTAECLVLDMPGRRPVLVYPCAELPLPDTDDTADALADLLGRTRASVLRALTASASTTQLARRTGISLASASEHARALRNAGLITTHRTAGTAHHSLTPTAHHLLTTPTPHLARLPR
ncbi:winged helix-turn-helix transcriptional regulator [Kribbella qitaiheensis]|uniref:Winged helix-turn-helix transcriptional regulator n=1 Tax=Kribbella qitaiheensis TaxID=1544730 RepID=A0A7G6X204_9ACTN|nr:winged helix-turn-helix domain-containing protein [Kribbella qitaiheensis]QNE20269.1 winged helix-turn-helix transcriptional regulator [Kribbella qitaiheensis]